MSDLRGDKAVVRTAMYKIDEELLQCNDQQHWPYYKYCMRLGQSFLADKKVN